MFTGMTPLSTIKAALIERSGFCDEIAAYFADYQTNYYSEAPLRFKADNSRNVLGWMLNNILLLGKDNSPSINEEILNLLMQKGVNDMLFLKMWRVVKNYPNIPPHAKESIVSHLQGKLPMAEKPNDWEYTNG